MRRITLPVWLAAWPAAFLLLLPHAATAQTTNAAGAAADPRFCFVQISDTHIGIAEHDRRLRRVVDMIGRLPMPVECVVHTGDIANDNLDRASAVSNGLAILRGLRVPLHVVAGNHDISARRPEATLNAYRAAFGELCGRAEYRGVVFLFVYTEPAARNSDMPGFDPIDWLRSAIAAEGGRPVIVFHHTPAIEDFYNLKVHSGWPEDAQRRWEAALRSGNVKAVVAGHFHRDELRWMGDIPVFVCAPVAAFYGRQGSFRVYEYVNGRLNYRTVYLE